MSDLDDVIGKLADADGHVRRAALRVLAEFSPELAATHAETMLGDPHNDVVTMALEILRARRTLEEVAAMVLKRFGGPLSDSAAVLLDVLAQSGSDLLAPALDRALKSHSLSLKQCAIGILTQHGTKDDAARIGRLLADRNEQVRLAALDAYAKLNPTDLVSVATSMLQDAYWEVRRAALRALADVEDPSMVDHLIPLARDADADVREAAIVVLAKFDDDRVLCELISSLNDIDADVVLAAESILSGQRGPVPSLGRRGPGKGMTDWREIRARVDDVNRWAGQIGRELLGKQVRIQNYRQGLGRTRFSRKRPHVTIEVSDTPITSRHIHGEDIMRGLVLHEIGHHLCDFGQRGYSAARGIARSEGIDRIFDILLDERLERRLRARRPLFGLYFDRLASYAFAQSVHVIPLPDFAQLVERSEADALAAVDQRRLPGRVVYERTDGQALPRVQLADHEMLMLPGFVPRLTAFLACLRCGFNADMHPDRRVAKAVALVPGNLKELRHSDVLVLARKIAKLIGTAKRTQSERRRLQKRMRRHAALIKLLRDVLNRLVEIGQVPGETACGTPGIRATANAPTPAESDVSPVTISGPRRPNATLGRPVKALNLGAGTAFNELAVAPWLPFDPVGHAALLQGIREHARRLRCYFERLARRHVEEYGTRSGRRLDLAQIRSIALSRRLNIMVRGYEQVGADAYLGILVDRSGSMTGDKLERAKKFCALLAEGARGIPELDGHISAFDDESFYRLGDLNRTSIATLTAGGGNNDAGALARAAELALRSGKQHRLLIMISDGLPTECTLESLRNLVALVTRKYGTPCVQVAVDAFDPDAVAFPRFVDLSQYPLSEAVIRFGKMIIQLTEGWRA
ncbi:MAG: hypothetical protein FJ276_16625 [Planctomycetes bacterium]|nr:hypothetical protein [Planctomycetota bacterium]